MYYACKNFVIKAPNIGRHLWKVDPEEKIADSFEASMRTTQR